MALLPKGGKVLIASFCSWFFFLRPCHAGGHWGYGKKGIAEWSHLKLDTQNQCDGYYQSPIDIHTEETTYSPSLGPLRYIHYKDRHRNVAITNNGHTVVVTPEEDSETAIAGAGLPGIYKLVQFHFHWGARSGVGSEHVIDGHPYAMEMHLVHMNTKYGTPEEAYKHSDGLAVVAVLFKVSRFDNLALAPIVQALRRMNRKHSTRGKLWRAISFARLLPRDARRYYRYQGSLTTPPCSEAVIWTVLTNPDTISERQLDAFRDLEVHGDGDHHTEHLVNNFRPPMPLHGRHVFSNFLFADQEGE